MIAAYLFVAVACSGDIVVRPGYSATIVVSASSHEMQVASTDGLRTTVRGSYVRVELPAPGRFNFDATSLSFPAVVVVLASDGSASRTGFAATPGSAAEVEWTAATANELAVRVFVGSPDKRNGGVRIGVHRVADDAALAATSTMSRSQGFASLLSRSTDVMGPAVAEMLGWTHWPECLRDVYQRQAIEGAFFGSRDRERLQECLDQLGEDAVLAAASADRLGLLAATISAHWMNGGDLARADRYLQIAAERSESAAESPLRLSSRIMVAILLGVRQRHGEALAAIDSTIASYGGDLKRTSPVMFAELHSTRAGFLMALGRAEDAIAATRAAYECARGCADFGAAGTVGLAIQLAGQLLDARTASSTAELRELYARTRDDPAAFDAHNVNADANRLALARIAIALGRPDDALELLSGLRSIERAGEGGGFMGKKLAVVLALALAQSGQLTAARAVLERNLRELDELLDRSLLTLTESERLGVVAHWRELVDLNLTLELADPEHGNPSAAYSHVLAFKGRVARRLASERASIQSDATGELARRHRAVVGARAQLSIALLEHDGPGIEAASAAAERAEADLVAAFPPASEDVVDAGRLAAALPTGSVAIDVVRFGRSNLDPSVADTSSFDTSSRYVAFVVRPDADDVAILDLGPSVAIDAAARRIAASLDPTGALLDPTAARGRPAMVAAPARHTTSNAIELAEAMRTVRDLVVEPVRKTFGDAPRWIVSPDGDLGVVPFDALPLADGRRLVEVAEVLMVSDFGSPPLASVTRGIESSALIVGDVAYVGEWSDLPGTGREVRRLVQLHREVFRRPDSCVVASDEEATASRLRNLVGGRRYVHLATHGFFRPTTRDQVAGSGLIFAPEPGGDSCSLWTDLDASWLDLKDAELVVLSACSCGLGVPVVGEGALGMRRSLRLAGARHVISALWPISDEATVGFVERFYERMWRRGQSPSEALRGAKLDALAEGRARGEPNEGLATWGAFVCEGWVRDS